MPLLGPFSDASQPLSYASPEVTFRQRLAQFAPFTIRLAAESLMYTRVGAESTMYACPLTVADVIEEVSVCDFLIL